MKKLKKALTAFALVLVVAFGAFGAFGLTACSSESKQHFVVVSESSSATDYTTFDEALENATDGQTIKLYQNATISKEIVLTKSITIDGQGKYKLVSSSEIVQDADFWGDKIANNKSFGKKMFFISSSTPNVVLKLTNVTLDANGQGRIIVVQGGKLIVDGSTLTGGKLVDNYAGAVYITNAGSFEMTGGSITGNVLEGKYANDNYLQYSADLWIGANANGALASITGGTIGNVFVNSNSYSANNPGGFTLDGGTIENIYVEYDSGYGASFTFTSGTINNMRIAISETDGVSEVVEAEAGNVYRGYLKEVEG